jgi:hypothetical protein
VKSQAEQGKVSHGTRPNLTRCEEACKSGTLLRSNWVGSAGGTEFSEAMLKLTRFEEARKSNFSPGHFNAAASNKRPSKVGLGLTSFGNIREDGV